MDFSSLTFLAALPEFILIFFALILVLVAAFARQSDGHMKTVRTISLVGYAAGFAALFLLPQGATEIFNGMFRIDGLTAYMKGLVLLGGFFACWLVSDGWGEGIDRAEFHLLVLMAILGMLLMISANDLISLYMALELQSLPLYVVAAMRTGSLKSSEAGLKYFLLGALSSGMLLYGASMVYGFSGSTGFTEIAASLTTGDISVGMTVGMVFLLSGLAFKISAAPFHMWTPDVYEGAPTPVTALFAIVPKVASITLMLSVTYNALGGMAMQWQQILIALSVISMIVGATGAIMQQNIKRMLAYSSIAHMGYALAGLASGSIEGATSVVIYMTTYVFMGAGSFAIIMSMRRDGAPVERISDLSGLSSTHPIQAAGMMVIMFSMAGIPPLAGFFAKWYVFLAAVDAGLVPLAIIGVLTSVIGAFYYLRLVKIIWGDESEHDFVEAPKTLRGIALISSLLVFPVLILPLVSISNQSLISRAASSLF